MAKARRPCGSARGQDDRAGEIGHGVRSKRHHGGGARRGRAARPRPRQRRRRSPRASSGSPIPASPTRSTRTTSRGSGRTGSSATCCMGLTTEAADGSVIPGAAESWEVSDDGTVYTFTLRDHSWSDGTPVTADDFVFALRRILDPAEAAEYASLLYTIKNAKALNEGAIEGMEQLGVQALDAEDPRDHAREPDALLRRAADPLHRLPDPQAQGRGAGRRLDQARQHRRQRRLHGGRVAAQLATSSWSRTTSSTMPTTCRSTA